MNKDPNFVKLVAPVKLISSYLRDFLIEQTFLRPSDLMTILQVHMKLSEANKSEMSIKICMDLAKSIHGVFIVTHEAYIICFSRDRRESACKSAFHIHDKLHCGRFEIKL